MILRPARAWERAPRNYTVRSRQMPSEFFGNHRMGTESVASR